LSHVLHPTDQIAAQLLGGDICDRPLVAAGDEQRPPAESGCLTPDPVQGADTEDHPNRPVGEHRRVILERLFPALVRQSHGH
jgi:hypothetical protein